MTVNIGVIGVGMIGQDHIRRLTSVLAGAAIVAVSDVNLAQAEAVASRLNRAKVYAAGEELIDASDVQVGFMRRFDPKYRAMKETIASGVIGAPLIFQSGHRNRSVPGYYTKDMALTDTAVHDIDIARFLMDDEPTAISVKTPRKNSRGGELSDPLFTLIEMRSGALVAIETSVNIAYGYDIRGEVIGETGVVTLAERDDVVVKANGVFSGRVPDDWHERFAAAFDAEFREWLSAAARGGAAGPTSWDGYVATVVSAAGVKALYSGSGLKSN